MQTLRRSAAGWLGICAMLAVLSACDMGAQNTQQPVQVIHLGLNVDSPTGAIMVRKGDTVGHIAERYRLNTRDIIDYNHLVPPYHLAENQRLLLPAPAEHKVGGADTLLRVARMYDVSPSELVQLNRLRPPYALRIGQVLRLPPTLTPTVTTVAAPEVLPELKQAQSTPAKMPPQPSPAVATPKPAVAQKESLKDKIAAASKNLGAAVPKFSWPMRGRVVSVYGPKSGGLYNDGINIAAARGSEVKAAASGAVVYVGSELHSYGRMVLVRHSGGYVTAYAHLNDARVARGDAVRQGQMIGTVGSSGTVAEPQLHFEIHKGSQTFDPQRYLGSGN